MDIAESVSEVHTTLVKRAERSRREGLLYVAVIAIIASAIIATFVFASPTWSITIENNSELVNVQTSQTEWAFIITGIVLRLGAVVLAVFLIQIFVSLVRYRFRVSEHLALCASALLLSEGEAQKFQVFATSLSVEGIDFGKLPESPYVEIAQAVRDGISKVTSK